VNRRLQRTAFEIVATTLFLVGFLCLAPGFSLMYGCGAPPEAKTVAQIAANVSFNLAARAFAWLDGETAATYRVQTDRVLDSLVAEGLKGAEMKAEFAKRMDPLKKRVQTVERVRAALTTVEQWLDGNRPTAGRAAALAAVEDGITGLRLLIEELRSSGYPVPSWVTQGLDAMGALRNIQ